MSDQSSQQSQSGSPVRGGRQGRDPRPGNKRILKTAAVVIGLAVVVAIAYGQLAGQDAGQGDEAIPTATVKRGALTISVTEGGTLHAMQKLEIKSEVEGNNQILEIVPEGTIITEEDVQRGDKVLVRLDTAGMEEKEASREISFYNAEAALVQARENHGIQGKQNESNRALAGLDVKFTLMDLDRYLGAELARQVLEEQEDFDFMSLGASASVELQEYIQDEDTLREILQDVLDASLGDGGPGGEESVIGGTARQRLRKLSADVKKATEELQLAQEDLRLTEQLREMKYVSQNELITAGLRTERAEIDLAAAKEELRLFVRYTLPKEAEEYASNCREAERQLERVIARNTSELAQSKANLDSKQRTFELEEDRLAKTKEMVEKSIILATTPGLVVYASTSDSRRSSGTPMQEGTTVRENQTILTIPDLSTLAARVNVHETDIEKLAAGQPALISVEALPGSSFRGRVTRISPMASSEHRWMNPDVMVYETDVALDGVIEGLSPGMSTTAEIVIAQLTNVLYVPLSAVTTYRGQRVCWVKGPAGAELRELETGHFTDKFVEVRKGLREDEIVYLAPPEELEEETIEEEAEREHAPVEPLAGPPSAGPPGGQEPGEAAPRPGGPGSAAEQPAAEAQPVDMDALRQQMEGLSPEERRTRMREVLESMPQEQREQMMQRRGRGQGREGERRGPRPESE